MRRRTLLAAPLLLAVLALLATLGAAGCASAARGLEGGALHPCPWTPNCACTQERGEPAPLAFDGEPEEALARLLALLDADPLASVRAVEGTYVHAVFKTPTLRFRDDVEFLLVPEEGVIHVRSASRLGFSDLGANARRIVRLRASW